VTSITTIREIPFQPDSCILFPDTSPPFSSACHFLVYLCSGSYCGVFQSLILVVLFLYPKTERRVNFETQHFFSTLDFPFRAWVTIKALASDAQGVFQTIVTYLLFRFCPATFLECQFGGILLFHRRADSPTTPAVSSSEPSGSEIKLFFRETS